jgi:Flp pilus assembly protein TadD
MVSVIICAVIGLCIAGILWMRQRRWQTYATPASPEAISQKTLAHQAFAQGNSCLAEGKFADAIAAFHQAREQEPKHPYVASRLAEAERLQHAVRATPVVKAAV